jgi:hypothetical protein
MFEIGNLQYLVGTKVTGLMNKKWIRSCIENGVKKLQQKKHRPVIHNKHNAPLQRAVAGQNQYNMSSSIEQSIHSLLYESDE